MIIPRTFNRGWVGPKPIPAEFQACWDAWQRLHPDWEFVTWTDKELADFGLINQVQFDSATNPAGKVDIAMYEILYRHGGVWLCCDMECYKNVEPLIVGCEGFSGAQIPHGSQTPDELLGCIMGCTAGHPLWEKFVDGIPDSVRQYAGTNLPEVAGPLYATRIAKAHFGTSVPEMMAADRVSFRVLEPKLVYPYWWYEEYKGPEAYLCREADSTICSVKHTDTD